MEDFEAFDLEPEMTKESFSQAEVVDLVPEISKQQPSPPRKKKAKKAATTKRASKKQSAEKSSGEMGVVPSPPVMMPMPPGITLATKPRDCVLELIEVIEGSSVRSQWNGDEFVQRRIIEAATKKAAKLALQNQQMRQLVRSVVAILDDESRHAEFYDEMMRLAELARE